MKYIPRNVMRQHGNFEAIRNAAGSDLTNDVYVRAPQSATKIMAQTFWFVGKGKNKRRLILAFYYFIRCEQFELISHLAAFIVSCTMCPSRARVQYFGGTSGGIMRDCFLRFWTLRSSHSGLRKYDFVQKKDF